MTEELDPWAELARQAQRLRPVHLRSLIQDSPARFQQFSARCGPLFVDFSKEKLDAPALEALLTLARAAKVEQARDALFAGDHVNVTEDRPALHMALRADQGDAWARAEALQERSRMLDYTEAARRGEIASASGAPFRDVLCLGTGGSSLGPDMAARALVPWQSGPRLHFVSNIDGAHLADTLPALDPATTLVTIASKSFTTLETMTNAKATMAWLGDNMRAHTVALTERTSEAQAFGIAPERVFKIWDWVGGRFSLWSSIGLPLAVAIGREAFQGFLRGAAEVDRHFLTTPLHRNLPVLLALIGIWRRNGLGYGAVAIAPYSHRLARLPAYFQQLEMESNGKTIRGDGAPVTQATVPLIFGEPGTDAQHSYFQLLHQGSDIVPVDFIVPATPVASDHEQHDLLLASALAQSAALALGSRDANPHKVFHGDRPSTTILLDRLDPQALGALIALYEHKVFVQGTIWGVNSFDQFGVELGKRLTSEVLPMLREGPGPEADASTRGLIAEIRRTRR